MVKGHGVHGVDLVRAVEVGVEAVHYHHQLVGFLPPLPRVDDERTVESLLDVFLQGHGVAVVEVHPERFGIELVDELLPRRDKLEDPVHARRVEAVEVERMRVRVPVLEHHPQQVALPGAQRGPRHLPVVSPRRVHHPRRHLHLHRLRTQLVLSNRPAALGPLLTPVEVPQELRGIEPREVHIPNRPVPPWAAMPPASAAPWLAPWFAPCSSPPCPRAARAPNKLPETPRAPATPAARRKSRRETSHLDPSMRSILFRLLRPRGTTYPEIILALSNTTTN